MPQAQLDTKRAFRKLEADPHLSDVVKEVGHIEVEPHQNPYEMLSRAIVFQQLSGKAGSTIWGRFLDLFPGEGMPAPEVVARKRPETLRKVGLSNAKASYIIDLAKKSASGEVDIHNLNELEDEQIAEQLLAVKGIGRWSVDMFLMFGLARPDILPTGDLGIAKGFREVFSLDDLPKPPAMLELAEGWRPYRTYACLYLWRSLDIRNP